MAEIKDIDLSRLHQEESFGFHQLVSIETAKCNDSKVVPLQADYISALTAFDAALKTGGTNPLSASVSELDTQRDNAYAALAMQVKNARRNLNPDKVAVAREVELILRKYGNPCALPYVEENGVIHNLIQELEDYNKPKENERPEVVSLSDDNPDNRLALIGALDWLEQLKEVNARFLAVFTDRNATQATLVTGASKAARIAADLAYRNIVKRINALAEINGDTNYADLIDNLNFLIDRQKTILSARKTRNTKKNSGNDRPEIV